MAVVRNFEATRAVLGYLVCPQDCCCFFLLLPLSYQTRGSKLLDISRRAGAQVPRNENRTVFHLSLVPRLAAKNDACFVHVACCPLSIEDLFRKILKMSVDQSEAVDIMCCSCAACGIKLKPCDGCDLVRYCSDTCREDHRPEHETSCKERAAELRDEILFKQPEGTYLGDCPICFLPIPIQPGKSGFYTCCSKYDCKGCSHANQLHQLEENMQITCPFCRQPVPKTQEEIDKNRMKRIAANDPVAIREMGRAHSKEGDYESAFNYMTRAAELGDAEAHYDLSMMYLKGQGVEEDEAKALYHWEEAAIRGHPGARHVIGFVEAGKGKVERAVKHYIIAANLGYDNSIQALKECYKNGDISKDDFAAALRAHHAAVEATKSPHREAAAKYYSAHV